MIGKLRINTNGNPDTRHWNIFLNDIDISSNVTQIRIDADANSLPSITLNLIDLLDFPDELQGYIQILANPIPDNTGG